MSDDEEGNAKSHVKVLWQMAVLSSSRCLSVYPDEMPKGTSCDFEEGLCGWRNGSLSQNGGNFWLRGAGPTDLDHTGPDVDHTTSTHGTVGPSGGNFLKLWGKLRD